MALADEKYVSFTTYKRDGGSTSVPAWIVGAGDGKLGFTTSSRSWKAKRLTNDDRVQIQPSDVRGRIKAKYGLPVALINVWGNLRKLLGADTVSDCAIVITLDDPDED